MMLIVPAATIPVSAQIGKQCMPYPPPVGPVACCPKGQVWGDDIQVGPSNRPWGCEPAPNN